VFSAGGSYNNDGEKTIGAILGSCGVIKLASEEPKCDLYIYSRAKRTECYLKSCFQRGKVGAGLVELVWEKRGTLTKIPGRVRPLVRSKYDSQRKEGFRGDPEVHLVRGGRRSLVLGGKYKGEREWPGIFTTVGHMRNLEEGGSKKKSTEVGHEVDQGSRSKQGKVKGEGLSLSGES